jgi:hypothetical protein
LGAFALNLVAFQVQAYQPWRLTDQVCQCFSAYICNFIVAEVNIFDINCVLLKRFTNDLEVVVGDAIVKHIFVVALDQNVQRKVVVVASFEVLDECCMHVNAALLGDALVVSEDILLVKLVEVDVLELVFLVHLNFNL